MTQMQKPPPSPDGPNLDPFSRIAGSYTKPAAITEMLNWVQDNAHLISPGFACARLPEGCSLAVSVVYLDPKADAHDVGMGKVGLLKHALTKIAAAAGIRFDPVASGRIDDGSEPYYVHWRAVGAWRHLDGSILPIVGDKEMDLREESAQVERIYKQSKDPEKQIREMRAFIMGHAQSKAELRAIRKALGIRSYTPDELQKPFVVVNLAFTGHSDDPQIRRENAAAIRASMLGGAQALFGPPPEPQGMQLPAMPTAPALPMPSAASGAHAPPPVHATRADEDDVESTPSLTGGTTQQPQQTQATPTRRGRAAGGASSSSSGGAVVKFGRLAGTLLKDLDAENLDWYVGALKRNLDDPAKSKPQYREQDEAHYREVLAELERRNGVPADTKVANGPAAPQQQRATSPAAPSFAPDDRGDDADKY